MTQPDGKPMQHSPVQHSPVPHSQVQHSQVQRRALLVSAAGLALSACSKEEVVQAPSSPAKAAPGALAAAKAVDAPDIAVGAMLLPGLINSATDGPMIDLVRAIATTYKGGTMNIVATPVGRVLENLENAAIDMSLPHLRMGDVSKMKHRYSTASFGTVEFVLYSKKSAPLNAQSVRSALAKGEKAFPYKIEAPPTPWDFPTMPFTNMASAFKKLDAGHIDGFLWAQEEADLELRRLGLTSVRREAFGGFEDVFGIVLGPRGDFVDKIISAALQELSASGKLQAMYAKIHQPFDPWQP